MRFFSSLCFGLIAFACAISLASAQTQPQRPDPAPPAGFGTVTGHVYFAGNNSPARLVNIALQPLQVQPEEGYQPGKRPTLRFTIYQTDLDGAYTVPHVAPGTYWVVVNEPGFLSPFTNFTPQEMAHPTPEIAQKMAATLPAVSVRPNATSTLDVVLQRGAGLSGTVRFDDGTPFAAAAIFIQRHAADGKWINTSSYSTRPVADADGHWQATGLPAGEYRLRLILSINDHKQSSLIGDSSSSSGFDKYTLTFYSGDTSREQKAQTFKLEDNQQLSGQDLTIPVSRLHALSGTVVDAGTGAALNAGTVQLFYADDGSYAISTTIDPDTRSFTFNFVPEGEYKLKIADAREVRFEPPPPDASDPDFPERNRREVVVRKYSAGDIPLTVQGEITGITVAVAPRSAKP